MNDEEFYVGYLPSAPRRLAKWVSRVIIAINAAAVALAVILVAGQQPFATSNFEYGIYREFEGVLQESPYPSIPGHLLVAPGKHGASPFVAGLNGKRVHLSGSIIHRDGNSMVEIVPGSIHPAKGDGVNPGVAYTSLGSFTVTGEIVDTKCYFGVMNPGSGKVHRDCAVRCISGGIPPGLLVRDSQGNAKTLLLTGSDGRPLNREVLDFVAEPVRMTGELFQSGDTLVFRTEPIGIVRVSTRGHQP